MTGRVLVFTAVLGACGDGPGLTDEIQVQIRDSAGVRIVEYAGVPEVEPPFALAGEPLYRHGANPGDYEFDEAAGFSRQKGGAVLPLAAP